MKGIEERIQRDARRDEAPRGEAFRGKAKNTI